MTAVQAEGSSLVALCSLAALSGTDLRSLGAVDLLSLLSRHSVKLLGWVVGEGGAIASCWDIHTCLLKQRGKGLPGCSIPSTGHRGSGETRPKTKGDSKR